MGRPMGGPKPPPLAVVVDYFGGMRGAIHVAFEEGTQAQWLHDLLAPVVDRVIVCDRRGERRGEVAGLGADCVEKELRDEHRAELRDLLERAGIADADPAEFRRYGSARQLYTFKVDNASAY